MTTVPTVMPALRPAMLLTGLMLSSGCVTVYQPLSGMDRPVAVEQGYANLRGLDVAVVCLPDEDALDRSQATFLCRRLARVFENQGARATYRTRLRVQEDDEPGVVPGRPGLEIVIRTRELNREDWTFIPWLWEHTSDLSFAQDLEVRDESGFLLGQQTLAARFTTRFGFSSDAEEQFSRDFYGQLSQMAVNAKVRRRVLAEAAAAAKPPPPPPPPVEDTPVEGAGVEGGVEGGVLGGTISDRPAAILGVIGTMGEGGTVEDVLSGEGPVLEVVEEVEKAEPESDP